MRASLRSGPETPAPGDAGSRPYLVDVARERASVRCQCGGQFDATDVDRLREYKVVSCSSLFGGIPTRALLPVGAAAVGKDGLAKRRECVLSNKNSDFFEPHDLFLPKSWHSGWNIEWEREIHPLTITNILGVMLIYDFAARNPADSTSFSGGHYRADCRRFSSGTTGGASLSKPFVRERSPRLRTVAARPRDILQPSASQEGARSSLRGGLSLPVLLRLNGAQGPPVRFPLWNPWALRRMSRCRRRHQIAPVPGG